MLLKLPYYTFLIRLRRVYRFIYLIFFFLVQILLELPILYNITVESWNIKMILF